MKLFLLLALFVGALGEDLGVNLVAELYRIIKEQNITVQSEPSTEDSTLTEEPTTEPIDTVFAPRVDESTVTCGYSHTSECDVSSLFHSGEIARGDILLLTLASDCSSSLSFATVALGADFDGHVIVSRSFPVNAQATYHLCQKGLVDGQVVDRGTVQFVPQPVEDVQCKTGSKGTSDQSKFMSVFNASRCVIPSVHRNDEGYFYTVSGSDCADFRNIKKNNLSCGMNSSNNACTFTLSRLTEAQTLCRCDFPVQPENDITQAVTAADSDHVNSTAPVEDGTYPICTQDMVEQIATLHPPAVRRMLAELPVASTGVAVKHDVHNEPSSSSSSSSSSSTTKSVGSVSTSSTKPQKEAGGKEDSNESAIIPSLDGIPTSAVNAARKSATMKVEPRSGGATGADSGSMEIDENELAKNLTAVSAGIQRGACERHDQCGTYGRCIEGACAGFLADVEDTRLIRCVEGYRCDVSGEVSGLNISSDFQVIGVSPGEMCGTSEPLPAKLSIFSNQNRWRCSSSSTTFCQFSPGVGQRRNKTIALEGLRLCGCPNADMDGNNLPCDSAADFFVPLAKLGVQECLTNAHCLHKTFAYCVNDHCAGFMGIAASAGMKAYQCLLNRSCSVQSIAAKTISEGLKIVPVAASFNCGAEQALDPGFYEEHSLPCIMDINGDGHCDIHLGVPRALGTNRLCGCNGSDRGGNGRPCDEPEDFDVDLGLLTIDECNMDTDCVSGGVCVANKCYIDSQAPYAISTRPVNGTETVPPVNEIRITFSETIRFSTTQSDRRVVLISQDGAVKYEFPIADPTLQSSSSDAHRVRIEGRDLVIVPDLRITSLPEGKYILGFEGGVVEDLQGNGNVGSTDFSFTITSDAGCPFLGVTGFGIDSSLNINGIYRSTGILNSRPKWTSIIPTIEGVNDSSQIFWYPGTASTSGRWVIGLSHDHTKFLSYLDVPFPIPTSTSSAAQTVVSFGNSTSWSSSSGMRPVSGSWKKWSHGQWYDQRNVIVECIKSRVTTPPRFIDSSPLPGSVGVSPERFEMIFTFDRPVTYGHWSQIALTSVEEGLQEITIDPEDEENVREKKLFRDLLSNQMILRLGDTSLLPGTEYWVTVDTGAFTDLQYNPVAPIVQGDFKITTYGVSCSPYPLGLFDHVNVDYTDELLDNGKYSHGVEAELRCSENYSPRFRNSDLMKHSDKIFFEEKGTRVVTKCVDGNWDFTSLTCLADCAPYQTLGKQYEVAVIKVAADNNDLLPFGSDNSEQLSAYKSGSQLKISCVEHSETLAGSSLGEITTCVNGKWSSISVKCGVTCPPFPDMGRAYSYDKSGGLGIGSSRTITCKSDALGDKGKTQTVVCQENGTWQKVSLNCYYNCGALDLVGLNESFGLIPVSSSFVLSKSIGTAGETYLFTCENNSEPRLEEDDFEEEHSEYWKEIDQNFPLTSPDRQTQIACVDGVWRRRHNLQCVKSCSPFVTPGPGYAYSLALGDGTSAGSTYNITCRADAVAKGQGADQIACLSGTWTRVSHKLECLGSCSNPLIYFGQNYRVLDPNTGLALPNTGAGVNYRHGSQSFTLECATGMQPLDAPLVADPSLHYLRGKSPQDSDAPIRIMDVKALTSLFEMPSQLVTCKDGEWIPSALSNGRVGARLLRCSPYCPSFNSLYSARYTREDNAVGFSWGSKRSFRCADKLTGGHFGRLNNGTLTFVKRDSVQLTCARGSWIAPMIPFDIPELQLSYTPLKDALIIKNTHSSTAMIHQSMTGALPCGRTCPRSTLESLLRRNKLRLLKPSRSTLSGSMNHGTIVDVECEVGSTRISGSPKTDQIGCSDGEWTMPLLVCGTPNCSDGAINQGEGNVDCGGPNCSTTCPVQLHKCETDNTCQSCSMLPEGSEHLYSMESGNSMGYFFNESDLPIAHGALVHLHHRESFYLSVTAVATVPYIPYLCINGSWQKLQVTPKRLLLESSEPTSEASVSSENTVSTAVVLSSQVTTEAPVEVLSSTEEIAASGEIVDAESSNLPKELNGLAELAVQAASCNDGVLSRGEWGIDCGGVCPLPCPDCFDSSMNGKEEWVDCGGSDCRACYECSMAELKAYDGEAYIIQTISVNLSTGQTSTKSESTEQFPSHGSGVRVSCNDGAVPSGSVTPLDLVCLDGRWWPVSLATEMYSGSSDVSPADFTSLPMYAIRCELTTVDEMEKSVLHKFRAPGLTLDFCGGASSSSSEFCCSLLQAFNDEMAGECGTLLYSGAVDGFCKGVCYQRIKQLTEFYDTLKEEAVTKVAGNWDTMSTTEQQHLQVCEQVSDSLKSISTNYCYQNINDAELRKKNATSPQSIYYNYKSPYCFSTAGQDLAHLRSLDVFKRAADINIACQKQSCFRNNVAYVDTMWQLIHMDGVSLVSDINGRKLLEEVSEDDDDDENEDPPRWLSHLEELQDLPAPNVRMSKTVSVLLEMADALDVPDNLDTTVATNDTFDFEQASAAPRQLSVNGLIGVSPVVNSIFRDPASVQYSDTVVPLMCLKDSKGDPCSSQFQQIMTTISLWGGQSTMTSKDRVKLGQAVASMASTCSDSSCFLQLSRYLGQEVSQRGTIRGDPYQRFMGLFLKLFGRYYCQNDSQGSSCAVKYLGWLIQGMQPTPVRSYAVKVIQPPGMLDLLPNCDPSKCNPQYINDGICDPQCFNVNCGFDGADCLLANMYPGIVQRLMQPISLTNSCHPLNSNLETCPKDMTCYSTLSRALISEGCCFAVGVDMLKEILDLEYYSHPLIRPGSPTFTEASQYIDIAALRDLVLEQHSSSEFTLKAYEKYTPDRSSIYSQTLCNLYQDRTCSRGMARRILTIYFETDGSPSYDALAWMMDKRPPEALQLAEFPYDRVDYDSFRAAVESELPVLRLKVLLRKYLSDLLVLPSTDVREVDIWPVQNAHGNQALIEIIVDPSLFLDETRNSLESLQESGEFQEMISAAVAQWRGGLSDTLEHFLGVTESNRLGRRLGEAAEVDQKKAMAVNVEQVRQMPVTRVHNVQFKIQTLDPISMNKAGDVVDSLSPSEGTFDLGNLTGLRQGCSIRTLISERDPWGKASLPFSNYIVKSGSITGHDGETLTVKCREPSFAPEAGSPSEQTVVCNNGRWIAADRQPLMECVKPCPHFHLSTATPHIYRVVGEGNNSGSTRRVSCASGYSSTGSAMSELLTCKDGKWSEHNLQCTRAPLFDGSCAGVPLDILVSTFHYKMAPQTAGSGAQLSLPNVVWWKATCQRGYEMVSGTEPLYLICLDNQRLLSFGLMSYHLQQKVLKPPSADGLEQALRQFVADTMPSGQMAEVELARLLWAHELPLKATASGHQPPQRNVTTLACAESIITKPELLVESGIDDWVYIGVVASIAFGATALFGLWGYYWQTRGRERRNIRKAKKLAAEASREESALLAQPTAPEVAPKYPSTEASELFPSSKLPTAGIQESPGQWQRHTHQLLRREENSSHGYYSDVEYYAKQQPE